MERLYLEEPSIKRKREAIEYIEEHIEAKSNINGSGGLDKRYKDYEAWLQRLELMKRPETAVDGKCPGYTFFLIRESDDRIIGMINIRYNLDDYMMQHNGHVGYGIRPSERQKGYNKINLYLGLEKCDVLLGLDKVLLTASDNNPASYKTILSLGGVLENKIPDEQPGVMNGRYWIDVKKSLEENYDKYCEFVKSK